MITIACPILGQRARDLREKRRTDLRLS